ncbi:MAG: hypothetical protein HRT44_05495, partial [Bdellovibrionales bacterium]|nr:hypothetical protein [Bdellovibrionales bacterium]NQZ18697.1 hypothetical protein [Bdellovibrionales bacterium]
LAETLLEDYLVFTTNPDCLNSNNNFFGIEKQILLGVAVSSCGGRRLTDDIMQTLYALYIGGINAELTNFLTGVNEPYQSSSKNISSEFPYIAAPEEDSLFNIKRHLLNTVIKAGQE